MFYGNCYSSGCVSSSCFISALSLFFVVVLFCCSSLKRWFLFGLVFVVHRSRGLLNSAMPAPVLLQVLAGVEMTQALQVQSTSGRSIVRESRYWLQSISTIQKMLHDFYLTQYKTRNQRQYLSRDFICPFTV